MAKLIIKQGEELETPEMEQEATPQKPAEEKTIFDDKKPEPPMQVALNMRRGLDGRLMICDHDHIDIVFLPDKNKLVAFAKKDFSDIIYETQTRLFDFLTKKGICAPESVRGGNVYGAFEVAVLQSKDQIPVEQLLVLNIKKWLDSEQPAIEREKEYEEDFDKYLVEPDMADSTELGEVPQEEEKGSIPKYASRRYIGGWW